jgi:hypothetical protein
MTKLGSEVQSQVWDASNSGVAPWQGIATVGSQRKIVNMRYCLAHAIFELDRRFLGMPGIKIGVARDERQGRLLVRFTASCVVTLATRRGVVWQSSNVQGTGDSITAATISGFKNLATAYYGAPVPTDGHHRVPPTLNPLLVKNMVCETEVVKTDSASNEIASCRGMFREEFDVEGVKCKFKNMVVGRDKAHGSRRTCMCNASITDVCSQAQCPDASPHLSTLSLLRFQSAH